MGSSISKVIAQKLYPQVIKKIYPYIDDNLKIEYANEFKQKIQTFFHGVKQSKLPSSLTYELPNGAVQGEYKNKVKLFRFFVNCRVVFSMWEQEISNGLKYIHARISFQTKFGAKDWVTAVAGQVEVRSSLF